MASSTLEAVWMHPEVRQTLSLSSAFDVFSLSSCNWIAGGPAPSASAVLTF